MPSLNRVLEFSDEMWKGARDIIARKGADYNRDQQLSGDTLFNLKVCELLSIVPSAEEGILVRLSDKFMRLISLTKPGREAEIRDESVLDTIRDMQNYLNYLGLLWLERKELQARQLGNGRATAQLNGPSVIPNELPRTSGVLTGPSGSGSCGPIAPTVLSGVGSAGSRT